MFKSEDRTERHARSSDTVEVNVDTVQNLRRRVGTIVRFMREAHKELVLGAIFEFVIDSRGTPWMCAMPQLMLASGQHRFHKIPLLMSHGTPCLATVVLHTTAPSATSERV